MTVKITKFTNSFSSISSITVFLTNTSGMTISHFASSPKATMVTLPFTIEGIDTHVPFIEEPEFCIVIRKKVNLLAVGPNTNVIKDIGNDVGKYKYINSVPKPPISLPAGFTELYKG
jgi:hypothetical protein